MPVAFQPYGVWTALVTPFHADGNLNLDAFKRQVNFQIAEGVTGLVPAGTTGESPTLKWTEHNHVIEEAVSIAARRVGVLAGTGSNSTEEAIEATRHAQEAGASAALVVDCYYNGPSSLELRTEYYEAIADNAPSIPIVPYIIPGRVGTELNAADLAILHQHDPARFPAVKEATGNLERMKLDRELCGPSLAILSGDDDLTLAMIQDSAIKASGVVSVMSNLVPGALVRMVKAARAGEWGKAEKISAQLTPLFKLVGCKVPGTRRLSDGRGVSVEDRFRNPVPVKAMMEGLGMSVGPCRRPLGLMSVAAVETCRAALKTVYKTAPDVLTPIEQAFDVKISARLNDDAVWSALAR
ncbi:MAG TPA: 4-hydroxy-tetrahydrodipicolinate synthase [Planctomycetota bacterium]|nr:4-hydroxy-tetrahydrodipicolinate synthase [Planctomycetota bacterium]